MGSGEEGLEMLRALSDETRQKILSLFFARKELRASEVADNFSLSRPAVSHHLNLMKRAKLLNTRKEGKEIYYSFNKSHVTKWLGDFLEGLKRCC